MKTIKIKFVDFWPDFDIYDNFITKSIHLHYNLVFSETPDYLFFSCFGSLHLKYDCVKIYFIGENIVPDFNICDYAIGFNFIEFGDRYLRLPLYVTYEGFSQLKNKMIQETEVLNRKFCNIVVSNASTATPIRERFFRLLSNYKPVDSGGRAWNNIGGPVTDKISFLKEYKFNIAFENSSVQGYTTEKIMEPMRVNSVPIYWGNSLIGRDFNENSFINAHNFKSLEELVEYIIYIDSSETEYLKILHQPWFTDNNYLDWENRLFLFLNTIIEKPISEAKYIIDFGASRNYLKKMIFFNKIDSYFNLTAMCGKYNRFKAHIMNLRK